MKETIKKVTELLLNKDVYDFRITCLNTDNQLLVACYSNYTESAYNELNKFLNDSIDIIHTEYDSDCTHGKFRMWINLK